MSASTLVTISDTSVGIIELQRTAAELDIDAKIIRVQILKLQRELNRVTSQRDALLATAEKISAFQISQKPTNTYNYLSNKGIHQ